MPSQKMYISSVKLFPGGGSSAWMDHNSQIHLVMKNSTTPYGVVFEF